jgi:trans-aconitate 2-methyltransferase
MSWSPEQYLAFEEERTRAVRDLVRAIPQTDAPRAVDLGCGPGNSTEVLAARFPRAEVTGVDSSPEMIAVARRRLPHLQFELAEIETWDGAAPFGVILANAVLQWVSDHATLLPRLAEKLAPGGSLALQMPDNLDQPSHRLMREVAAEGPWASKLASAAAARTPLPAAGWYYALLQPLCTRVDLWRTTYHHPLAGAAAVVEWVKGSGLRPFLVGLDPDEQSAFLARYQAAVERAYPPLADGTVLLVFPRLFIVATR